MIETKSLSKTYEIGENTVFALRGVDLSIGAGEFVAVMGPSGSGKSTLMNVLGCLDRPTEGSYQLDGKEVSRLSDDELALVRNRKIGFVFQSYNLLPKLSALENVELPLVYRGVPWAERRRRAVAALRQVGLDHRMGHKPSELSGGQQQRVAIARVTAASPVMVLADEPTGNLDSASGTEIMRVFQELNDSGTTIVLVTHDDDIAAHAKRIVRLRDGYVVSDEPVVSRTILSIRDQAAAEVAMG